MLIQTIKAAHLAARKARDSRTTTLLTTVIGEADMVGKSAGNRESTAADYLDTLRKFEKNLVDNIRIYGERHVMDALEQADFEIGVIRQFLPAKMTDLQVQKDIGTVMQAQSLAKEQKSMGAITKALRAKYGDQYEGGQVSAVFKQMIV